MASQYKHAVLKYATFAHLRQQSLYELDFKSIDILKAWFMKVETALCEMLAQLHNQCFTFFIIHEKSLSTTHNCFQVRKAYVASII